MRKILLLILLGLQINLSLSQNNYIFSAGDTIVMNDIEFIIKDTNAIDVINDLNFIEISSRIDLHNALYSNMGDPIIYTLNDSVIYFRKIYKDWLTLYMADYETNGDLVKDFRLTKSEKIVTDSGSVYKTENYTFQDTTFTLWYVHETELKYPDCSYTTFKTYDSDMKLKRRTILWFDEYGFFIGIVGDDFY